MKKFLAALACALVLPLAGCSADGISARSEDGDIVVDFAGVKADIPDGWSVYTGAEVYDKLYEHFSGEFADADEFRRAQEDAGQYYIAFAESPDKKAVFTLSAQNMTLNDYGEEITERIPAGDFARSVHDNTIFDCFSSGFRTGDDSSFSEESFAGKDGWVSFFEVYLPGEDGGEPQFVSGQREFMFEQDDYFFFAAISYSDSSARASAENVQLIAP